MGSNKTERKKTKRASRRSSRVFCLGPGETSLLGYLSSDDAGRHVERVPRLRVGRVVRRGGLAQRRTLRLALPVLHDLLVRRAAVLERRRLVGGRQVAPERRQRRRDVEPLQRVRRHADVVQLRQHDAVEVVGDVAAEEAVRRLGQVGVEAAQLGDERVGRVRDVLDVEREPREHVATGARRRHVVVRHRRVAERAVDVQRYLVRVGDDVVAVAKTRKSADARLHTPTVYDRARLRVLVLKLPNPVTSLPSYALSTGSK